MRILITGASGFIGRALCGALADRGHQVTAQVRRAAQALTDPRIDSLVHADLGGAALPEREWQRTDVVIHLAALAAVARGVQSDEAAKAYREVNVDLTRHLAQQAAQAGVRGFVFLSSTRVHGGCAPARVDHTTPAAPDEPYGTSKRDAEQALEHLHQRASGLAIQVLRIPPVYGPGVKGGFGALLAWIARGRPLPLGAANAPRSLLCLDNLTAALIACVETVYTSAGAGAGAATPAVGPADTRAIAPAQESARDHAPAHPQAPTPAGSYRCDLLADRQSVSLADIIRTLSEGLGRPLRNWPIPTLPMKLLCQMMGKQAAWQRLAGAAEVDASEFYRHYRFEPPVATHDGLLTTARNYAMMQ